MFDTTYAAAWQLGRLLALQNQSFALTLSRIRKAARAGEDRVNSLDALSEKFGIKVASVDDLESKAMNKTKTTPAPQKSARPRLEDVVSPAELDDCTDWLARLFLLYGVPFDYLVSDAAMLPHHSIRFFTVDPVWMRYLIQGAVSIGIGGHGKVDILIDQALRQAANRDLGVVEPPAGCDLRLTTSLDDLKGIPGKNTIVVAQANELRFRIVSIKATRSTNLMRPRSRTSLG